MPALTAVAKTSFRWVIRLAVMLGVIYLLLAVVRSCNCPTEVYQTTTLSGFDFEISRVDCPFNPSMNVFVSRTGQSWLTKEKTLLFEYSGGVDPLPVITQVDQHAIQISTPWISSVWLRRARWEDLSINYNIAGIDYLRFNDIVSFGHQLDLSGSDLVEYVRREVRERLAKGTKPFRNGEVSGYIPLDYGNGPDEIADAIIAEWVASGQNFNSRDLLFLDPKLVKVFQWRPSPSKPSALEDKGDR